MSDTVSNGRIAYFDNIKFLLIILVVFGHMIEISDMEGYAHGVRFFIYTFHMPAFIFVAGLFFDKNNTSKCLSRVMFFLSIFVAMRIVDFAANALLSHTTEMDFFYVPGMPWFVFAMATWCVLLTLMRNINPLALVVLFATLALIVGYDDKIGPFLVLSRIIVFFPFFILGTIVDKDKLIMLAGKPILKFIAATVFVISFILILAFYDDIRWMESMLSGQNPYSLLGDNNEYGFLVRLFSYFMTLVIGTSFILAVSCRKLPISTLGQRSLGVYFWDNALYYLQVFVAPELHVWQYFIAAVVVTVVLSNKYIYVPFKKLMKVW